MKKAANLLLRIVLICLIGVIFGTSVYTLNAKMLLHDALPMPFGFGTSVVLSGSMEPTLSMDDFVIVQKQIEYAEGDIVVYQSGSHLVIHRIVTIDQESIITQGDANNAPDDPITKDQIKGKMICHIPGVGNFIGFVQSGAGKIIVMALAVILIIFSKQNEEEKARENKAEITKEIEALRLELNLCAGSGGEKSHAGKQYHHKTHKTENPSENSADSGSDK